MEDNVSSEEDEVQEGPEGGGPSVDGESAGTDEEEQQFDISLAASHSYMGPRLVAVSGRERAVIEPGWEGRVPVLAHHGTVFPGETVPMLLTYGDDLTIMAQAMQTDKLFGLLCPDESGTMVSGYGVLCEVYERGGSESDEDAEGEGEMAGDWRRPWTSRSFKARATHRFRCKQMPKHAVPIHAFDRMRLMEVRVLAEVRLGDPLRHVRLTSLDPLRGDHSQLARRLRGMDATLTPWPLFVYDIFDFRRMRHVIKEYFKTMAMENIPEDAVALSFWTASNLALSPRDRLALFVVDDALLRLHMEVRLIAMKSVLCCASCAIEIARREHIFAMSTEGVHSNYTNLGGFVHDIITVSRVANTAPSGAPSAEFSWFPGYTWTITLCAACMAHVGWRFDAQRRNLRPQQFYGLCRNYVQPRGEDGPPSPSSPSTTPPRSLSAELRATRHALSALVYAPSNTPRDA
ncbi:protein cereblon-like isoform X2 [Maniola jurtina]|uniref:protein cereblon-like isoform X2 n=1 Tax=Maniola jurtina TaxID=191418 RepID=UPI001E688509|nr:protein cereblon-like isoform X2 [Maniola jurtina]